MMTGRFGMRLGGAAMGLTWLVVPAAPVSALDASRFPALERIIDGLADRHAVDRGRIAKWIDSARIDRRVVDLYRQPAERKPWYEYRELHLQPSIIDRGVEYWRRHAELLGQVEERYGVPAEIVVGILGVETRFGSFTGNIRVLDALTTLLLEYEPRRSFAERELPEFFLLALEEQLDPLTLKGSYAGAIGIPQFIPSSYRHYAIDFDGDGRRDLVSTDADAVGSVASYLARHGWRTGEPLVKPLPAAQGERLRAMASERLVPEWNLGELRARGVGELAGEDDWRVGVVRLEQPDDAEYRVGYHNFYVITRYNRSSNYAMSVIELGEAIRDARSRSLRTAFEMDTRMRTLAEGT